MKVMTETGLLGMYVFSACRAAREAAADRGDGGEGVREFHGELEGHVPAVGDAGCVDALRVGLPGVHEAAVSAYG